MFTLISIGAQLSFREDHIQEAFDTAFILYVGNPQLQDLVIQSGYRFSFKQEYFEEMLSRDSESANKIDFIREKMKRPLTLQRLAANVIRTSLRPNAVAGLKHLQLPPGFDQSYITLGLTKEIILEGTFD